MKTLAKTMMVAVVSVIFLTGCVTSKPATQSLNPSLSATTGRGSYLALTIDAKSGDPDYLMGGELAVTNTETGAVHTLAIPVQKPGAHAVVFPLAAGTYQVQSVRLKSPAQNVQGSFFEGVELGVDYRTKLKLFTIKPDEMHHFATFAIELKFVKLSHWQRSVRSEIEISYDKPNVDVWAPYADLLRATPATYNAGLARNSWMPPKMVSL